MEKRDVAMDPKTYLVGFGTLLATAEPRKVGDFFGIPIYEDPMMPSGVIELRNACTGKIGRITWVVTS